MEHIRDIFGSMISYSPAVAEMTRSVSAAIFLNQLLYWWERKKEGKETVYKTISEIKSETFLSRHQQDKAIKVLSKAGFIEVVLKGNPPKRHFLINVGLIKKSLIDFRKKQDINDDLICQFSANIFVEGQQIDLSENGKLICRGSANKFVEGQQILYTDITTNITTKNTTITCGEKNSPPGDKIFFSEDFEEKKENNPPFLRSAPLEKEKKEKVPKSGFSETTKKMKAGFLEFYLVKKGLPYYWLGKDAKNIIEVEKKISFMLAEMQKIPDSESVSINFRTMLENISDKWILDNLSISIINMKFNEIVSKIKNRNNERNNDSGRKRISPGYERDLFRRLHGEQVQ